MKILTRKEYKAILWEKWYLWKEECPFCDAEEERIVWKWKYWFVLRNFAPYTWDENHLMAIPYEHRAFSKDLTDEELLELKDVHQFMESYFKWQKYFSFTRETLDNWLSRSVEHLHMHFVPGVLYWKYLMLMLKNQGFPVNREFNVKQFNLWES